MTPDMFERLEHVLRYARDNTHSSFYAKRFAAHQAPGTITTQGDWRSVPLLSKEDILAVPYRERIFVEETHVSAIRHTSGTTGSKVLFLPRSYTIPRTVVDHFPNEGITGILTFVHPQHYHEDRNAHRFPNAVVICGHPPTMEHAVRQAAHTGANFLYTHTFLVQPLLPLIEKYGLHKRITLIGLVGELVTDAALQSLRTLMPHARIIAEYTSIETQGISGVTELTNVPQVTTCVYTPQPDYFWELIDIDSGVPIEEEGRDGEIVMTTLWTLENAFPLIRYRTGDRARLSVMHQDPWQCRYEVLGRVSQGRIRMPGGELRLEEMQRVIAKHRHLVAEDFELHFYEDARTLIPQVHLKLIPVTNSVPTSIADSIAAQLRVGPKTTYEDGVREGRYAPLTCEYVEGFERTTLKKVYFFRHTR